MVIEGTAYWASISKPNTTYEPKWTINVVLSEEDAKDFASRGHTVKESDDGSFVVIKRKCEGNNGPNNQPRLLDINGNDVNVLIGNGSKVKVQYREYDWEMNGKSGKGLDLQAVKILDLVPYSAGDGDELVDDGEEF
jgi:hypothetical protein